MTTLTRHDMRRAQVSALSSAGYHQRHIAAELGLTLAAVRRYLGGPVIDPREIAKVINAGRGDRVRGWRNQAVCREADPEMFFPNPTDLAGIAAARAVCVTCPVMQTCGNAALDANEKNGIWGGLTEDERARMRRNRVRADGLAAAGGPP